MGLISSLLHTQCVIAGSTKEYLIAPVFNNTIVLISLLFPSRHKATKAFFAKKSSGRLNDDIINGFLLTCGSLACGFSACDALVCVFFYFNFCMVMRLTLNLLMGFRLWQFIVLWPISLHEKHLLSFVNWSFLVITN